MTIFANPAAIIVSATTVALHHIVLWLVLPESVFNYDASLAIVLVHALFVVVESVCACFVARRFFDNIVGLEKKIHDRTTEIVQRSNDLAHILDTVRSGSAAANCTTDDLMANTRSLQDAVASLEIRIREIGKNSTAAVQVGRTAVQATDKASQTISELSTTSQEIQSMVRVITSIAEQTNLLALNATIEAARAGELGKGFAVVANEVKELARQTTQATEDIVKHVESIQNSIKGASNAITGVCSIMSEVELSQNAIADAVDQQSAAAATISSDIRRVAENTGQISRNIQEVNASVQTASLHDDSLNHAA